jgi:putative IMPACT (imprinted ancient) family translation regulator
MSGAVNLCVTVTRYFGGILLGGGGLVRAYGAAAAGAISDAGLVTLTDFSIYEISCSYSEYQRLSDALSRMGAEDEGSDFGADVTLRVSIDSERGALLENAVTDMTSGKCFARKSAAEKRPSKA